MVDNNVIIITLMASGILTIICYVVVIYNQLVSLKNSIQKNWSNIDVLLKQRNSELIKLVDSCKEYMTYEKETFEKIVKARNSLSLASDNKNLLELGKAEMELRANVRQLFVLAENYPDLKTSTMFGNLQHRISELENSISDRREFYNESVNLNNTAIEQFPTNIIARNFGFKEHELLKFSKEEKQDVNIKQEFNVK